MKFDVYTTQKEIEKILSEPRVTKLFSSGVRISFLARHPDAPESHLIVTQEPNLNVVANIFEAEEQKRRNG